MLSSAFDLAIETLNYLYWVLQNIRAGKLSGF